MAPRIGPADPASALATPSVMAPSVMATASPEMSASAVYGRLTGRLPEAALIGSDAAFDFHVLACILAVAASEGGALHVQAGLSPDDLAALLRCFPAADIPAGWRAPLPGAVGPSAEDDEAALVRDLLLARRSSVGEVGRWLAGMVARRAMEANHLWEDLGLRDREELTRLMARHFAPLATRNTNNMRWKRFFYRMMCEDDGFVMCATPVCTQCADFSLCFGDESGESRLADRRRSLALAAAGAPDTDGTHLPAPPSPQ